MRKIVLQLSTLAIILGMVLITDVPCYSQNNTIYACITKSTGQIRIVSVPGQCKANEASISWNVKGPPGEPGPAGGPGPQGEPGEPGPPGVIDKSKIYPVYCGNESPCECYDNNLALGGYADCGSYSLGGSGTVNTGGKLYPTAYQAACQGGFPVPNPSPSEIWVYCVAD